MEAAQSSQFTLNLPPIDENPLENLYTSRGGPSASNGRVLIHLDGTDLSASPQVKARVSLCQWISAIGRSRIFRSAFFAGAAVALTHTFALASATAAMGAGGTALAGLVGTVAAGVFVAMAANPLTYVALLAIGITALAITILAKKRSIRFVAALVTVVAAAAFVMIAATPPAWVVLTAVGIAALGVAIVCQLPKHGAQKLSLECSSIKRLFLSIRRRSANEIAIPGREGSTQKLYLGPIPSRLTRDLRHLNKKKGVTAVLAFNQPLEKINRFVSHFPYSNATAKDDGILARREIVAIDHKPVSVSQLADAADFIHQELDINEQSVYVHCLAGVGRSAMGVAAYLIKYHNKTVDQAIAIIKTSRPASTINKASKRGNLDAFEKLCMLQRRGLSDFIPEGMSDAETAELLQAVAEMERSTELDATKAATNIFNQIASRNPRTTLLTDWETKKQLLMKYKIGLNETPAT